MERILSKVYTFLESEPVASDGTEQGSWLFRHSPSALQHSLPLLKQPDGDSITLRTQRKPTICLRASAGNYGS